MSKCCEPINTFGWTPIVGVESIGTSTVLKVIDWIGGTGKSPLKDLYIGLGGLSPNVNDALPIGGIGPQGPQGPQGAPGGGVLGSLRIAGTFQYENWPTSFDEAEALFPNSQAGDIFLPDMDPFIGQEAYYQGLILNTGLANNIKWFFVKNKEEFIDGAWRRFAITGRYL